MVKLRNILLLFIFSMFVLPGAYAQKDAVENTNTDGMGYITGKIESENKALVFGYVGFYLAPERKPNPKRFWRTPDYIFPLREFGEFDAMVPEGKYYVIAVKKAKEDNSPPEPGDHFFYFTDAQGSAVIEVKKDTKLDIGTKTTVPVAFVSDPSGDAVIKGTIQDEEGNPVPGIYVGADKKGLRHRKVDYISRISDKYGRYELRLPEGGDYHIVARTRSGSGEPKAGDYYARLCKDNVSPDFRVEEFADQYTVKRLSDALRNTMILNEDEKCDTVKDLNQLLKRAELYGKITAAKNLQPSERLTKLKKTYDRTMNQDDLKKLNRLALEEFYREETPKSQKDKPVTVKTGETLEKNITVYKIE